MHAGQNPGVAGKATEQGAGNSPQTQIRFTAEAILNNRRRPFAVIWPLLKNGDFDALTDRELYTLIAWLLFAIFAILVLFFTVLNPGPPKVVTISTGSPSGAYYVMAQEYKQRLAKHGIRLEVAESTGSIQNLERLRQQAQIPDSSGKLQAVTAAFVQSGTSLDADSEQDLIESLASVAFEPIWVFHGLGKDLQRLADLKGKRIAIGAAGTGVQFAARRLLEKTGITASNSSWLELGGDAALDALRARQLDAIILVAAPGSKTVGAALEENFGLLNFAQADAYLRNFPWLQKVTMPRGSVNLARDLPAADVTLIAATANLAVSANLHPALAYLLLDVASEVHAKATLTQSLREFPNERSLEFRQSEESKRYFKNGRPFLQRYLPFWLANLVERLMSGVVPILIVLVPMLKLIPAFFAWREKAQVSRLYTEIKNVETEWQQKRLSDEQAGLALQAIEHAFDGLDASSPELANLYNAKSHLELLRTRMSATRVMKAEAQVI